VLDGPQNNKTDIDYGRKFTINRWQHPATYGGRKHLTANTAAAIINTSPGCYTATLDLTQAFGHVTPAIAINTLQHLGLATSTVTFLANNWQHQLQYLTYDQHYSKHPNYPSFNINPAG